MGASVRSQKEEEQKEIARLINCGRIAQASRWDVMEALVKAGIVAATEPYVDVRSLADNIQGNAGLGLLKHERIDEIIGFIVKARKE